MTTAMYDAREAIIPGSVYDRSSQGESALRGSALALWVLIVPTPAAFGLVTPGVTSQASVHRKLPDRAPSHLLLSEIKDLVFVSVYIHRGFLFFVFVS